MSIRIRAVAQHSLISDTIHLYEDFWASHVEAVFPDGYIGAHADGGVKLRPVGYDAATLKQEQFINVNATDQQSRLFEQYMRSAIGTPYDFGAILGFALHADIHQQKHVICSACLANGLLTATVAKSYPIPTWEISPRDLLLFLSALQ